VQHKKEKERREDEEGEGEEEGWKRRGWRPKGQRVREMRSNMFCDEDDLRWEKETKMTCEDDSLAVFAAVAVAVCVMVGLAVELVLEDEM
jgi:hypothetical protein